MIHNNNNNNFISIVVYMLWFDFIFGLIFVKPVYIFQTGSYF